MSLKSSQHYEQVQQFTFDNLDESIVVFSKPGLPDWNSLPHSTILLTENSQFQSDDHLLQLGCHHGALSVSLARRVPDGYLNILDTNTIALDMTRLTLQANAIPNATIVSPPDLPSTSNLHYDCALISAPKGRLLTRRWLLQAYHALKVGGCLYIAGSNNLGIQSSIKDAAGLFGNVRIMAYRKGNRIAHLVKTKPDLPMPAWASSPGIASGTWVEFSINFCDHDYPIRSLPGVFSSGHLDMGTQMLLNTVEILPGIRVLDVGCGYGIMGLYASLQGCDWVDLVDSDLLAVASCRKTFEINTISNFEVFAGDLLQPVINQRYDLILSNPPFHAGRAVDYQVTYALIRQSFHCLTSGGQLIIVANRFLPYDQLINDIFGNVSVLAESGKFYVLTGRKTG